MTSLERRTPHLLPGFGLTLGVTLLYFALIIVLPLAGDGCSRPAASAGRSSGASSPRRASLAAYRITFTLGRWPPPSSTPLRPAAGLGADALPLSRQAPRSMRWSTCPSRCRPPSPGSRWSRCSRQTGWFGQFLEPLGIKVTYTPARHHHRHGLHLDPLRGAHGAAGARGHLRPMSRRPRGRSAPRPGRSSRGHLAADPAGLHRRLHALLRPRRWASSAPSSSSPATCRC